MAKNCGTCDYCESNGMDLICTNDESEYLADFISRDHACEDWKGSEEECE